MEVVVVEQPQQEEKAAAAAAVAAGKSLGGCCSKSCTSLSSSSGRSDGSKEKDDGQDDEREEDDPRPNNNRYHLNQLELRELNLPRRRPVDLDFVGVRYTVTECSLVKFKRTKKEILHGISGCFKSGELTAIMGPSGAGKSSLLNILAGLTTNGMEGKVYVNGKLRNPDDPHKFQKLSRYIQQDDSLRPYLTVGEAMSIAAHLKLGYSVDYTKKRDLIHETLTLLGLEKCYKTLTVRLSGGQRKRLAIALELLSNPPILFLDEPTTGLDSSSCSQCVSLLKRLSQEGRTIICTIHQPSALIFEMFDKLYALANGYCIYSGPVKELVPFLGSQNLVCPPFHNPADYLIEISHEGADLKKLAAAAKKLRQDNKFNDTHRDKNGNGLIISEDSDDVVDSKNNSINSSIDSDLVEKSSRRAHQYQQTWLLCKRNLVIARRDYSLMLWRFCAHILIALLFGYLYQGVGRNADTVLANYIYLYGSLLLLVYTGKMSVTLSFPLEMEILKREHFNKWYNLGPYVISVLAIEVPFQILCSILYISISYVMTGNSLVDFRLMYFFVIAISTSLCGQSWGYLIGATTPVKIAVFIGPVIAVLFSVFGFCLRLVDTPYLFRWLFHISYFRAGFHSLVYSVYGLSREKLLCDGVAGAVKYCHYRVPEKFLKEMDITDIDIWGNVGMVVGLGIAIHVATVGALWCRLNRR